MVSMWPFGKRDDNSPDSFERILAKLATQIQTHSSQVASLRQRSRRLKALWTLYSLFAYTIQVVLIVLLQGYQNLGPKEGAGIVGGPFVIYGVRKLLAMYYDWRISTTQGRLDELQSRQRDTIEKLKTATKYSTTQSIIEKYGGVGVNVGEKTPKPQQQQKKPATPRPADPTRNRPQAPERSLTPQQQIVQQKLLEQQKAGIPPPFGQPPVLPQAGPKQTGPMPSGMTLAQTQAQTQPSSQQHLQPEEATAPKWYDRILDVLVGEDETSAKARYALICKNCRMVNGLAPPGTKDLNDMEPWGCARCGTMNGSPHKTREGKAQVEDEDRESDTESDSSEEMVEKTTTERKRARKVPAVEVKHEDSKPEEQTKDGAADSSKEEEAEEEEESAPPRTRSRGKGRKRK